MKEHHPLPSSPERIGPYRILERVGEGGMGEVFLAEQIAPVHRRVAVKVIKPGMDSRNVLARFESEQQALALMDHPGIARMIDAGTTEQGRPYFVMEYVSGLPLTDYCDRRRMPIAQRLRLFVRVCLAVQHAHQKGVIHRDLKPTNILVAEENREPVPKIIDFGIAKATGHRLTEATVYTQTGHLIGTPEYMSPEQAASGGFDVDTRADVYSLGAVLYELLSGTRPFIWKDPGDLIGIRETILERDPPAPSERLKVDAMAAARAAQNRHSDSEALRRCLVGDLDSIVSVAMNKEPGRRYPTAQDLARDVESHLDGRPITARPDTFVYRMGKFARRNRMAVGALGAILVLVLAFAGSMTVQANRVARERDRANHEAEIAREVSGFLKELFRVSGPDRARGETITAREILDRGIADIDARMPDPSRARAELKHTMGEVYEGLGLYADALPLVTESLETRRRLLGEHDPETLASEGLLGILYWRLSRFEEAEPLLASALEGKRRVLGEQHIDTLAALNNLANLYFVRGNLEQAAALYEQAWRVRRELEGPQARNTLLSSVNLANVRLQQERPDDAEALLRPALDGLRAQLGEDHPHVLGIGFILAGIEGGRGEHDEAIAHLQEILAVRERVLGPDHPETITTVNNLAIQHGELGDHETALALHKRVLETRVRTLGEEHLQVALAHLNLGLMSTDAGRPPEEALAHVATAATRLEAILGPNHEYSALARFTQAQLDLELGERETCLAHLRVALEAGYDGAAARAALQPLWGDPAFEALIDAYIETTPNDR